MTKPRQISLRALARELSVNHSSLSSAIHDRRLTRGVRIDDDTGRVVVFDADAAAHDWRDVHMPQILEVERAEERARNIARRLAATHPEAIVLTDVLMDRKVTASQLFEERNALLLLATAFTAVALADRSPKRLKAQISKSLRKVAPDCCADADGIARAWEELESAICVVVAIAEDES